MQVFAIVIFVAAMIALVVGFTYDTTVGEVHNIGLLNQKQNIIILGSALAVAGAVLFRLNGQAPAVPQTVRDGVRPCPHCAELVKNEAKVCAHCRRDVPSLEEWRAAEAVEKQSAEGICPNCEKTIPLLSAKCMFCQASFGTGSAWRVTPTPTKG